MIALWTVYVVAKILHLLHRDPALQVEQMKASQVQQGQKRWDKIAHRPLIYFESKRF